ncbi:hypothetical protein HMPREF9074_08031 [Capnocytophaga sp. oral taxon 329 str. F0087]|nr:hypothetical protein HMPREF9074_08031 [Capnocytophaga sp. oral taxon 329 str. F0087]
MNSFTVNLSICQFANLLICQSFSLANQQISKSTNLLMMR